MLLDRHQDAQTNSAALLLSAGDLMARSLALRTDSRRLREVSSSVRDDVRRARLRRTSGKPWFTVRGILDERLTTAHWSPGFLDCEPELVRRAQVVVSLGETFASVEVPGEVVEASLEQPPIAVLLTIMRALSTVTAVDLSLDMFESP